MKNFSFEIVIEREADPAAGYSASCPTMPGCYSNGQTLEQARENIREAITLHAESLRKHGQKIPETSRLVHVEDLTLTLPS